jgi:histone H3/H4
MYISQGTVKRIFREAGAQRISMEATDEMRKYLNKLAFRTAQKAVRLSRHAKRKTVELSDVRLARD